MTNEIVLPKSGLVLKAEPNGEGEERWYFDPVTPPILYYIAQHRRPGGVRYLAYFTREGKWGTRDECIAWLDAKVLELRSVLLPADALERVAKALYEAHHGELSGWTGRPEDNHLSFRLAGVVLSALGLDR